MKSKEEIIKKAYGEYFDTFKDVMDEDGYVYNNDYWYLDAEDLFDIETEVEYHGWGSESVAKWRPGLIEDLIYNNGWIKIESKDDLPKEYGEYYFRTTYNTLETYSGWFSSSDIKFYDRNNYFDICEVTHYQPIIKPKPPLY